MTKKLTYSLLAVALITMLVSGATFALFTASTTNQSNTFTAGTVTLGTPTTTLIDIQNMAPGDSGTKTYSVAYTGSLDAFLGLDASVDGTLFDPAGGNPLRLTITNQASGTFFDSNVTHSISDFQLNGIWTGGANEATNLTINYALPLAAGNFYQGAEGTLTLTVHAVQAANNTQGTPPAPISWNN